MKWKEIELSDEDIFTKAFNRLNSQASEMSFRYLYMWRKNYNIQFSITNNMLCIVSVSRMYPPFAFCPVPLEEYQAEDFKKMLLS